MKPGYLGEFEELLLLAIINMNNDAYGVQIKKLIEEKSERSTSYGAIYTSLERLEKKGYVTGRMGDATAERGGRAKRYYQVTGAGKAAVEQARTSRDALRVPTFGLGKLAGGAV